MARMPRLEIPGQVHWVGLRGNNGQAVFVSEQDYADALIFARAAQALASSAPGPGNNALSEREHQVLSMLGRGESNASIAASFAISVRTVETYFERISAKLAVDGTRELRRYAIKFIASGTE